MKMKVKEMEINIKAESVGIKNDIIIKDLDFGFNLDEFDLDFNAGEIKDFIKNLTHVTMKATSKSTTKSIKKSDTDLEAPKPEIVEKELNDLFMKYQGKILSETSNKSSKVKNEKNFIMFSKEVETMFKKYCKGDPSINTGINRNILKHRALNNRLEKISTKYGVIKLQLEKRNGNWALEIIEKPENTTKDTIEAVSESMTKSFDSYREDLNKDDESNDNGYKKEE